MTVIDFYNPMTQTIVGFLREIGLDVQGADLADDTSLPGIAIADGTLLIDEERLRFPGDLLHEAGHLAVVPADRRPIFNGDARSDTTEEQMAITWSYAALVHLGLNPEVVFHCEGYGGQSERMIANFNDGHFLGLPSLEEAGMTANERLAEDLGVQPYPSMICWLREA